jgi:hypothetical protein
MLQHSFGRGTQASSGFWIGNILQFGWGEESPRYLLVANNLSLVFFAFLFHSFPQEKKKPTVGKKESCSHVFRGAEADP